MDMSYDVITKRLASLHMWMILVPASMEQISNNGCQVSFPGDWGLYTSRLKLKPDTTKQLPYVWRLVNLLSRQNAF